MRPDGKMEAPAPGLTSNVLGATSHAYPYAYHARFRG